MGELPVLHELPTAHHIRFGVFELNTRSGELHKNGVKIPLRDQSLRILEMLLNHPGELVTREEIKRSLWPADTFVEFDHSINAAVTRLRQALGDPAENPRFIETLPGRGYRFIAPAGCDEVAPARIPGSRQFRRAWLASAGALLLIAAGVALWLWHAKALRSDASLQPKRMAVAIFENRTGDQSLDPLGRIAADWISDGLSQLPTIAVSPGATAFEFGAAGIQRKSPRDPARALAEATGAVLVVSGAYYKQGHAIQIHARITDVAAHRLLYAVDPVSSPLEEPMQALETVRSRVINAVAARYLSREFDFLSHESRPPSYEAYREFLIALEIFYNDFASAIPHLNRALQIDPDFTAPRVWLIGAESNIGNYPQAAAEIDRLEQRRSQLTPINRRRLDFFRANLAGRYEEALVAQREVASLARGSPVERFIQAGWAIDSNYLREAVEALRAPVPWEFMVKPAAPFGSMYFLLLTAALHELGDHRQELAEARRGRAVYPNLLNVRIFELRALLALGRFDESEKLMEQALAMAPGWDRCTAADVRNAAAAELRAHGHRDASLKMAARAVAWLRGRPGEESGQECSRRLLGLSLYRAERWAEAKSVFAALSAEHPGTVYYRGMIGSLAAHQGDPAGAQRISDELRRIDRPYVFGEPAYQRARLASLLGDKVGAVTLLCQAVAEGFTPDPYGYRFICRHDADLEPLRGYPAFEELLKPRE